MRLAAATLAALVLACSSSTEDAPPYNESKCADAGGDPNGLCGLGQLLIGCSDVKYTPGVDAGRPERTYQGKRCTLAVQNSSREPAYWCCL